MRIFHWLAIPGLVIAGAAWAQAETEAEPAADSVALVFGWQPGFEVHVEATKTRERNTDTRTSNSGSFRYSMRVQEDGENLRVLFENAIADVDQLLPFPPEQRAQLLAHFVDLAPNYLISRGGEFLGVPDVPEARQKLREFLGELMPVAGEGQGPLSDSAAGFVDEMIDGLTSEAFIRSKAAEDWNGVAGAWVGGELEIGTSYGSSNKEPVAMFPGEEVLMNYTFTARRRLPCSRGGVERGCVELEMRSVVDSADMERIIKTMFNKLDEDLMSALVVKQLEVENLALLVTEPDGLIPHSYRLTKTVEATFLAEGEEAQMRQVDTAEKRYSYPEPAAE